MGLPCELSGRTPDFTNLCLWYQVGQWPWCPHCTTPWCHRDDVIKWTLFPRYWPFVRGIHRSPVNSPHKGQWRQPLIFSLICAWTNGWVNNRDAGDLRRHRAHYDVTVMTMKPHLLRPVLQVAVRLEKRLESQLSSALRPHAITAQWISSYGMPTLGDNRIVGDQVEIRLNSLAPGTCGEISKCKFLIHASDWILQNFLWTCPQLHATVTLNTPKSVQVIAWCREATDH